MRLTQLYTSPTFWLRNVWRGLVQKVWGHTHNNTAQVVDLPMVVEDAKEREREPTVCSFSIQQLISSISSSSLNEGALIKEIRHRSVWSEK